MQPPAAPPPDECEFVEVPTDDPFIPDIALRWENRIVRGGFPLEATGVAVITRWIRLPEGRVVDGLVAAAITDAVIPAVFGRVEEQIVVPTVDLTIHFRSSLPLADVKPDDYVLADFRTNVVAEGFLEEDGQIWSRDGVLLAQSRQLAGDLADVRLGDAELVEEEGQDERLVTPGVVPTRRAAVPAPAPSSAATAGRRFSSSQLRHPLAGSQYETRVVQPAGDEHRGTPSPRRCRTARMTSLTL
jgi:hypothetical protein